MRLDITNLKLKSIQCIMDKSKNSDWEVKSESKFLPSIDIKDAL